MSKIVVIGAGPMGLAAAYRATQLGHEVDLVEADQKPGGMAAHFDFSGLSIERFYHFVCKSDQSTFDLMDELGIAEKMKWADTSMAYFTNRQIFKWGDPVSLLKYPYLTPMEKVRTGFQMFLASKSRNFDSIESMTAREWIERGSGKSVYNKLWKRLNELKFYEYADEISASWIATRIKRLANSTRGLFQQQLGYIEGGSEVLIDSLADAIRENGGQIHLGMAAEKVTVDDNRVTGLDAGGATFSADAVISTIPIPLVNRVVPDLPESWKRQYDSIRNIGVVCVLFKFRRPVTRHFWVNIIEPDMEIPGIIEFSNLRPLEYPVVYVPYYMPTTNEKWKWDDSKFIDESLDYIKTINPELEDADVIDTRVSRLRYAQPVCEPNFLEKIPPVKTPIAGLQIADTSFYYPEDRGIGESVKLGRRMAERAFQ